MINFIYILFAIFIACSIFLILRELGLFGKYAKKQTMSSRENNTPNALLKILNSDADEYAKAHAFVDLIKSSYVFVQVQNNAGNNYDDEVQAKKFDSMLTENALKNLSSLEGKNGQYSF